MFQDEACLWKAFQQGDIRAFEVIYETHSSTLLAYGKRLCTDHHLVKDIVQDIFMEIWTRRRTLRDLHTIKYYLFKIMRNKLSRLHQKTAVLAGEGLWLDEDNQFTPSIEFLITQQETSSKQLAQLQNAIARLPGRQREAIMLAFYHDFSNDEIAGIMSINHQSVINHLNRALSALRDLFLKVPILALLLHYFL
ncbi:RNA polymerase sigma factor [Spirosoma utsteinense]|uniref:RNA polymerase sigma factor n=1 Tax=Spirosoma utsteinense TaxID=2585773 RepID=UPI0016474612|nr:sigma-70 family RNA polymerase sigma factor [Spirosoma utsteinense]